MKFWNRNLIVAAMVSATLTAVVPLPAIAANPFGGTTARVSASQDGCNVNVRVDIDWKELGKQAAGGARKLWKKIVGRHPIDQQVYRIKGKWDVVVIKVTKSASGGRITNGMHLSRVYGNMDDKLFTVYFANTGSKDPRSFKAQAKKNQKWAKDGNWGPVFSHGYTGKMPGAKHRYIGARSDWEEGSAIVIAPADMHHSELAQVPGIVIKHQTND